MRSMDDKPDDDLIESFIRSGELSHIDALVRRHIGRIRAMIFAMVLNNADADDLTQEVFVRAVNGLPAFGNRSSFTTWLYRIAMNTTHTFLNRKKRNPVENREDPPDAAGPVNALPLELLIGRESDSQLTAALNELPPTLRSAITLTCIHGFSVKEAAEAEGCLAATLYWRVHRARKLLRATLTGTDGAS